MVQRTKTFLFYPPVHTATNAVDANNYGTSCDNLAKSEETLVEPKNALHTLVFKEQLNMLVVFYFPSLWLYYETQAVYTQLLIVTKLELFIDNIRSLSILY